MSKNKPKNRPVSPSPGKPETAEPVLSAKPFVAEGQAAEFVEFPEPRAETRALPIWLIVLLFILLYWGDMYIMDNGADLAGKGGPFPAIVYDPFRSYADLARANPVSPEQEARNKGQQVYNFVCVQCHQVNGTGLPGQFPPLVGSEWVLDEGPARMIRIVLNGLTGPIEVKGGSFNNNMPPWKGTLNDEQIAHVLSFVRREWGNNANLVTPEEVAKIRGELQSREAPFTAAELKSLPDKIPGFPKKPEGGEKPSVQ